MPWTPQDAQSHTHKADTLAKQRQWADVANSVREETGSDSRAIRAANAAVGNHPSKKGK